jgi:hypothetical protein
MKCKQVKDWLYLYGDGELSPAKRRKLERHLDECPVCRREQQSVRRMAKQIQKAGSVEPQVSEPGVLTQTIMNQIAADTPLLKTPVLKPALRLAMALTVVIIVGLFALQTAALFQRVSFLEERIAAQTIDFPTLEPTLASFSERPDGWVLVKSSTLQRLVRQHPHLSSPESTSYWQRIQREIPGLGTISLNDGLSRHEVLLLLKKREEILELLPNL